MNGYETEVSDIAKLITMKKTKKSYYFLIDSEYEIKNLNNIDEINQNYGSNSNQKNTSEVINDFYLKIEEQDGMKI